MCIGFYRSSAEKDCFASGENYIVNGMLYAIGGITLSLIAGAALRSLGYSKTGAIVGASGVLAASAMGIFTICVGLAIVAAAILAIAAFAVMLITTINFFANKQ